MKIVDYIRSIWRKGGTQIPTGKNLWFLSGGQQISNLVFADVVFLNICQLITDLCNDVTLNLIKGDRALFDAYKRFFDANGQRCMDLLYRDGVVVIGHESAGEGIFAAHKFRMCKTTEYTVVPTMTGYEVKSNIPNLDVYALRSATFETEGKGDKDFLQPWLQYMDNVLNASNTVSARLGSLVVGTPNTPSGATIPASFMDFERKEIEKEITDNYGALDNQSQFLLFGTDMKLQVVNLSGLDQRTVEKFKTAVVVVADRLKAPANQIGMIDALNSGKAFANGSEIREGDFAKYQTFERMLNRTFIRCAADMGMTIDYTIYNKPQRRENV